MNAMNPVISVVVESWHILLDSAPFILLGFFMAGLLKAFLPDDLVGRHLGKGRFSSVVKASILGVPLPL
jgi:uncharacterized membrane protein YraQ (UPF0718 family)